MIPKTGVNWNKNKKIYRHIEMHLMMYQYSTKKVTLK